HGPRISRGSSAARKERTLVLTRLAPQWSSTFVRRTYVEPQLRCGDADPHRRLQRPSRDAALRSAGGCPHGEQQELPPRSTRQDGGERTEEPGIPGLPQGAARRLALPRAQAAIRDVPGRERGAGVPRNRRGERDDQGSARDRGESGDRARG